MLQINDDDDDDYRPLADLVQHKHNSPKSITTLDSSQPQALGLILSKLDNMEKEISNIATKQKGLEEMVSRVIEGQKHIQNKQQATTDSFVKISQSQEGIAKGVSSALGLLSRIENSTSKMHSILTNRLLAAKQAGQFADNSDNSQ